MTVSFDPVDRLGHLKGHFGEVFNANPIVRSNQLWMYKSADFNINITESLDPVDGFGHSKGLFGVVFQGLSNHDIRLSMVTLNLACSP